MNQVHNLMQLDMNCVYERFAITFHLVVDKQVKKKAQLFTLLQQFSICKSSLLTDLLLDNSLFLNLFIV